MKELIEQSDVKEVREKTTDEILNELSVYGEPWLSKFNPDWICSVDVFVTGKGVTFKVKSEGFGTPQKACSDCHRKLSHALRRIREGKSVTERIG